MESNFTLRLQKLRLPVHLGCSREERATPQFVSFDVRLRFAEMPPGCETDRLEDTICYADLSDAVKRVCSRTEFALIEKLGWDVFRELKSVVSKSRFPAKLWIEIHKEKPPISELLGGSLFSFGEWTPSA